MNNSNAMKTKIKNPTSIDTARTSTMQPVIDFIQANKLDEALAYLQQLLIDSVGMESDIYCQMGILWMMKNDDLKAESMLLLAVKTEPGLAEAYFNLGLLYQKQGYFNKALSFFKEFLLINGQDAETFEVMGDCCMSLNNFNDATIFYDSCLKINPKSLNAAINLAQLYLQAGNNQQAIRALKIALVTHPDKKQLYFALGEIHKVQNEWENAIGNFRKVVILDDSNARAFYELGYCCYQLNLVNQAIPLLAKAYKLDPLLADTLYYLGKSYESKKNLESATSMYNEWVEMVHTTSFHDNDPMKLEYHRICEFLVDYYNEQGNIEMSQRIKEMALANAQPVQNSNSANKPSETNPLSLQIND